MPLFYGTYDYLTPIVEKILFSTKVCYFGVASRTVHIILLIGLETRKETELVSGSSLKVSCVFCSINHCTMSGVVQEYTNCMKNNLIGGFKVRMNSYKPLFRIFWKTRDWFNFGHLCDSTANIQLSG